MQSPTVKDAAYLQHVLPRSVTTPRADGAPSGQILRGVSLAFLGLCSASVAWGCSSRSGQASGLPGGSTGGGGGDSNAQANAAGASSAAGASDTGGASNAGNTSSNAGDTSSDAGNIGGSSTGTSGVGGGGGGIAVTATTSEPSGMPIPSTTEVPRPSGTPGNFTVLNWAGFKAAASFTFDDSLSSQISNYAALQATGVPLTFYLVSNNNGASATWTQAAKDGHELGNHTADHCHDDGSGCFWGSYAGSLGAELDQCTMHIEQQFSVSDVWTAASPYGDTGYETADSTRFLLNRGTQSGSVAANDNTSPYALPCHVAAQSELASVFNAVTDAARSAGNWQIFLIHSLGGDGGYNPISISDAVSAINHAKSAGDTWSDSLVHIGAYWRAQKLLSNTKPAVSGTSQTWNWTLPMHFPRGRYLRVKVDGGNLTQGGTALAWSEHGYFEIALDIGAVTLSP